MWEDFFFKQYFLHDANHLMRKIFYYLVPVLLLVGIGIIIKFKMNKHTGDLKNKIKKWEPQFPHAVSYQVFVRSFADGNGDGIGDLEGIRKKLPYLSDLGIGAIWLTPIFESPTYHKYDIVNYSNIDKEYGNLGQLKDLITEAHKLRIKIILDFAANHTSTAHEWFKEAVKGNPEYKEFYNWSSDPSEWNKEPDHWHWVDDNRKGAEKYYGMFWRGMPDLNYDNEKVRTKIIEAASYWISECDIDGYRLDAASHIYPYPLREKNHLWWKQFADSMRKIKPDFYLVGEMWGGDTLIAPYLKSGFNAGFNFDLWFNIKASLQNEHDEICPKLFAAYKNYAAANLNFSDAIFLSNHDNPRIMDELNGNKDKARQAAAILFTLPYTPYVYYGDELGMFGPKPDEHIREPFLWQAADPALCKWEPNFHNAKTTDLNRQKDDPISIYNTYRNLIQLRNHDVILNDGQLIESAIKKEGILSYIRQIGEIKYLVLHNLTSKEIELDPGAGFNQEIKIIYKSGGDFEIIAHELKFPKYSTIIIQN